ncbi:MAG TPA: protein-glutamate O-methyltransferase [Firmicutes bacterium]|nr:protein-glutamate O-methyltransferase [Candidatus Fermentithermobacillaceae bacterium]
MLIRQIVLSDNEFNTIRTLVYDLCSIDLHPSKKALVQMRLSNRIRILGLNSFSEYLRWVANDASGKELGAMVDSLTTNLTSFFRERPHFVYLTEKMSSLEVKRVPRLRIWSAGCSSGEEPYSIAMILRDLWSDIDAMDVRILATDISSNMIRLARQGTYSAQKLEKVPFTFRQKYFGKVNTAKDEKYQVKPEVSRLVYFRRHNLTGPWPMKGPFEVIFCRNVMIYFDRVAQQELASRFYNILSPGGVLIVGHSEGLTGLEHSFQYVRPSVYMKRS